MVKTKPTKKQDQNPCEEIENKFRRALADYSNLEKRFTKESTQVIKFANASLLSNLLSVKDNLERAAKSSSDKGLDLILSDLNRIFRDEDVEPIITENVSFNPNTMECEEVVSGEKEKIIEVTQKGYILHDRVLRPARVKVGNGQNNTKNNKEENK